MAYLLTGRVIDHGRVPLQQESWDDVIRKVEKEDKPRRQEIELNHEKSKQGLAEVYEQEVTKKNENASLLIGLK